MPFDSRKFAVATAGFCAFLNLYSPQALLPALAREFGVGAAEISTIMTASALAIALTAPFTGAIADVLGRKRVITAAMFAVVLPMAGAALAQDVQALIAWRFVQGLLLPPIFAVTIAYIGDEWPAHEVAGVAGIYIAGSSIGGFCGRFVPGVLADLVGWRGAFLVLAALSLAGAVIVALLLPREKHFVRSEGLATSARQMLRHLKNPQLARHLRDRLRRAVQLHRRVHLCELPPRRPALLLLLDAARRDLRQLPGRHRGLADDRLGDRPARTPAAAARHHGRVGVGRAADARAAGLPPSSLGLILCAACGMLVQTISTGYVTAIAKEGRSSAVGLYVTAFYIGGSMGAFLPGLAWDRGGWPACVAMVVAVQAAMALIAALAYRRVTV